VLSPTWGRCLTLTAYTAMVESQVLVVNFSSDDVPEIALQVAVGGVVCDRLEVTEYSRERDVRGQVRPQPWERDVDQER
jgi:hypothetical protein